MSTAQPAFYISNLSKSFGDKIVLQNIDLEVPVGQSLVVIGGSGSGKSVLLKCILGLMMPNINSKIIINGEDLTFVDIANRTQFVEKFGMLFQGGALFDGLSIWQNITFRLFVASAISVTAAKQLAREKLAMVGLSEDVLELYPSQISGGMQKRVAIARAIALEPNVIFFDEPTAGLDPIMANTISDLIANITKQLHATTITITHDMICMHKIADKVAMLHNGSIAWHGNPSDMQYVDNQYLKQFLQAAALS